MKADECVVVKNVDGSIEVKLGKSGNVDMSIVFSHFDAVEIANRILRVAEIPDLVSKET